MRGRQSQIGAPMASCHEQSMDIQSSRGPRFIYPVTQEDRVHYGDKRPYAVRNRRRHACQGYRIWPRCLWLDGLALQKASSPGLSRGPIAALAETLVPGTSPGMTRRVRLWRTSIQMRSPCHACPIGPGRSFGPPKAERRPLAHSTGITPYTVSKATTPQPRARQRRKSPCTVRPHVFRPRISPRTCLARMAPRHPRRDTVRRRHAPKNRRQNPIRRERGPACQPQPLARPDAARTKPYAP